MAILNTYRLYLLYQTHDPRELSFHKRQIRSFTNKNQSKNDVSIQPCQDNVNDRNTGLSEIIKVGCTYKFHIYAVQLFKFENSI